MPLSPPVRRKLMHTRTIECTGYEREDGLWDIEAHLTDTKTYTHSRRDGGRERSPGDPVHNMRLRLTIDLELVVQAAEAVTDDGPYAVCGDVAPAFAALAGLKIGPGWRKEIAARVGGVKGCTHLVELLGPLGTTAYQATGRAREERTRRLLAEGKLQPRKPYQINSCHVYKDDSPAVLERWPEHYTGQRPVSEP